LGGVLVKNLFCHVACFCNLVVEFNGLVSNGVNSNVGPFTCPLVKPFSGNISFPFFARSAASVANKKDGEQSSLVVQTYHQTMPFAVTFTA
jgi:hypothetical protein